MILCVLWNCRLKFDLSHQNRVVKVLTCLNRSPIQPCIAVKRCLCVITSFYQGHGATYLHSHPFIRPGIYFIKKIWKAQMSVIYSFNWAKFCILLCSQIPLPAAVFCLVCKKHSGLLEKESSAEPLLLSPGGCPRAPCCRTEAARGLQKHWFCHKSPRVPSTLAHSPHICFVWEEVISAWQVKSGVLTDQSWRRHQWQDRS